jgi:CspA family cold shock protein
MTKAPELDAGVCRVELGGVYFSGTGEVQFSRGLFLPGRICLPDADRRDNSTRANATTDRKEFTVSDREKGTVKWFNGAKGYGFIQRTSGEDVFVHFSAIQENGYRTLNEGETVEYDLLTGPKGLQASNVVRA